MVKFRERSLYSNDCVRFDNRVIKLNDVCVRKLIESFSRVLYLVCGIIISSLLRDTRNLRKFFFFCLPFLSSRANRIGIKINNLPVESEKRAQEDNVRKANGKTSRGIGFSNFFLKEFVRHS